MKLIDYDRDAWWKTCFALRGTVLFHVLNRVGLLTGFALLLYLIDDFILIPNNNPLPALDSLGHSVLGVALSMLIVFRTNSSNNRYWEARSHWGMLVNSCRNLARLGATYLPPAGELANLIAAYVIMLKEQLRGNFDANCVRNLVPGRLMSRIVEVKNPAQGIALAISQWIHTRLESGKIDTILASQMESLVNTMVDNQGGCEKIHKTPLPFVYAALIKQVLFLYLATLPFVLVPKMNALAPLVVAGVSLCMLGIEEAGVEVENPFGLDDNHLPLDSICQTIQIDSEQLTRP